MVSKVTRSPGADSSGIYRRPRLVLQLKRFEDRAGDPLKSWKLTAEDWENREKRPAYEPAVEEMFAETDQPYARWRLVSAESKRYVRVRVIRIVSEEIEAGMRRWGQEPPAPQ